MAGETCNLCGMVHLLEQSELGLSKIDLYRLIEAQRSALDERSREIIRLRDLNAAMGEQVTTERNARLLTRRALRQAGEALRSPRTWNLTTRHQAALSVIDEALGIEPSDTVPT